MDDTGSRFEWCVYPRNDKPPFKLTTTVARHIACPCSPEKSIIQVDKAVNWPDFRYDGMWLPGRVVE
ncbi:hypothetical protein E2C01_087757 [Portunus trituberculatus]|uniref:Uncharacterized protein n=1 Tax=Portunus trituberculatus TaxID=210409 RepID=A0A5B7JK80_PORTR|nr:hypothetical protein [Portunus trituberculatus]